MFFLFLNFENAFRELHSIGGGSGVVTSFFQEGNTGVEVGGLGGWGLGGLGRSGVMSLFFVLRKTE